MKNIACACGVDAAHLKRRRVMESRAIVRQHALVTYEDGKLVVEDLNSANGTFVNRVRIYPGQKRDLAVGDVLQIGTVQMKLIV